MDKTTPKWEMKAANGNILFSTERGAVVYDLSVLGFEADHSDMIVQAIQRHDSDKAEIERLKADYEELRKDYAEVSRALRESMEGHCPDTRFFCGSCDKGRKLLKSMGEMWTFMPPKEPISKSPGEGK